MRHQPIIVSFLFLAACSRESVLQGPACEISAETAVALDELTAFGSPLEIAAGLAAQPLDVNLEHTPSAADGSPSDDIQDTLRFELTPTSAVIQTFTGVASQSVDRCTTGDVLAITGTLTAWLGSMEFSGAGNVATQGTGNEALWLGGLSDPKAAELAIEPYRTLALDSECRTGEVRDIELSIVTPTFDRVDDTTLEHGTHVGLALTCGQGLLSGMATLPQ